MKLKDLENKKILLVGYGKEGRATETFLKEKLPLASVAIADAAISKEYLNNQHEYDVAIKSPGILPNQITIPYTTATNIFFELVQGLVIGVSGTKGKSTTASLIYAILKQAGRKAHLVGNIGNPMLSELLLSNTKDDVWVCELSSFQLVDINYSPHIAIIVSLFPEHMNFHGTVENYYEAKSHMIAFATEKDFVVYSADFPEIVAMLKKTKAQQIPFIETLPFSEKIILLPGEHNKNNVRGAVTVAKLLNIPDRTIEVAVGAFQPLRHRLQLVGIYDDIRFYDDAISTTPQSAIKAVEALQNIGTIFLGGQDRGYDFSTLAQVVLDYKIPNIVLFPQSGETILKELEKRTKVLPNILHAQGTADAVAFAYLNTKPGTICLMSPASPSFSLWKNYEQRGDEFQEWVKKMGETSNS